MNKSRHCLKSALQVISRVFSGLVSLFMPALPVYPFLSTSKSAISSALFLLYGCFSHSIYADSSTAARDLARHLADQPGFFANFEQQVFNSTNVVVDRSSGQIILSRPFHLRWETTEPFSQVIIINNDRYMQHDSDIDQLIISSLSGEDTAIPKLLLSANAVAIETHFFVSFIDVTASDNNPKLNTRFLLVPVDADSLITELTITFSKEGLARIVILDDFQTRSQFVFNEIISDKSINSNFFELTPPADTDIIYR